VSAPPTTSKNTGIDVRVDLPGVGQNLQDHLFSFVVYDRTDEVPPAPTSNIGEAGGYMYVDEDEPAPDLQFHFTPIYYMEHGLANPEGLGFDRLDAGPPGECGDRHTRLDEPHCRPRHRPAVSHCRA